MTTTYWHVGRRLVEQEQQGAARAGYGEQLLKRLSLDLSKRFGRGFSERNLEQMRAFYLGWPISQAASAKTLRSPNAERESLRRIETLQEGAPERRRPPIRDFEVQWPASSTAVRRRNR
jgi:hypothetical protein